MSIFRIYLKIVSLTAIIIAVGCSNDSDSTFYSVYPCADGSTVPYSCSSSDCSSAVSAAASSCASNDETEQSGGAGALAYNGMNSVSAADMLLSDSRSAASNATPPVSSPNQASSNATAVDTNGFPKNLTLKDAVKNAPSLTNLKMPQAMQDAGNSSGSNASALSKLLGLDKEEPKKVEDKISMLSKDKSNAGIGFESARKGEGNFRGTSDLDSGSGTGSGGAGNANFGRGLASDPLMNAASDDLDAYLERAGILSLFERVHPVYGKWEKHSILERAQIDLKNIKQ